MNSITREDFDCAVQGLWDELRKKFGMRGLVAGAAFAEMLNRKLFGPRGEESGTEIGTKTEQI